MTRDAIQKEDINILNLHSANNTATKYIRQN